MGQFVHRLFPPSQTGADISLIFNRTTRVLAALVVTALPKISSAQIAESEAPEPSPSPVSARASVPSPVTPGLRLVAKYDWTLTTTGGGGGALGVEFDHFEVGVMGFASPLPPLYRDTFLTGAGGSTVKLNWGAEAYAQWYPAASRRWLFVGGLISFDGFKLESSARSSSLQALYVAPRVGLRIPLGVSWLFFEPSVGAAIRVWDSSLGDDAATVRAQPVAPLMFLSIGAAIGL